MSAADDMREALITRLYGALAQRAGVSVQTVTRAVDEAMTGTDWANMLDGLVAADAAAQAYKLAHDGSPPANLATYDTAWSGARAAQRTNVRDQYEVLV
ncbi:MAG: hypothetical protein JWP35_4659 [Caulobacter sp.]|nr:hypothetical protein [Caulobacter sp.]